MTTITSAIRSNITQLLNRPVTSNKSAKSTSSEFASSIDRVGVENAAKEFITLPSQTKRADNLFDEMACEGLPVLLRNATLNEKGDAIRNMLGIIYKHAEPKDEAVFQKVFDEVSRKNNDFGKEEKLSSELSFLFSKYGQQALDKHVSDYMQYCREAWEYHHTGHDNTTTAEDVFLPGVMACHAILEERISRVCQPDQTWTDVYASGVCFKNTCTALSKVLKYHNIQPSSEAPAGNNPEKSTPLTSESRQPEMASPRGPDISIPANNGHGPISINNTVHGGNGTATINGNTSERAPASDIDFGITLLNTPDKELGNQKARLVEKFMDLYWGRAENGGKDKFSDHVVNVVQTNASLMTPSLVTPVETLPSARVLETIEEPVLKAEPQPVRVIESLSLPVMGAAVGIGATQKMENVSLVAAEYSVPLGSTDAGKNLQHAVTQVAQALSALVTESDTSVNPLHNKQSGLAAKAFTGSEQDVQPAMTAETDLAESVGRNTNTVQQLVRKFEALNTQLLIRNESSSITRALGLTGRANSLSQSRANTNRMRSPTLKLAPNKFNVDVNVKQTAVYTTNRTIDPFSRHSADVKHLANSFNPASEEETNNLVDDSDSVSNL
ncbi:hypothetical protein [Klebsiella sp. BIGb0407]|uniref:hypothetical protein n=1 Tax=Klebsiella sp. BIGb0407 TaxID=2940603 RepID=UPI002167613C|nr:hypothetical protein [Klebsiella sp. BIGb0407]MCS3431533.1 uncharacterized protein YukE [Klebsiella sp. BIGb0407]